MHCFNCGLENRLGVLFCENCGIEFQKPTDRDAQINLLCPDCESILRPGVVFCENCGHAFQSTTILNVDSISPLPDGANANQTNRPRKKNGFLGGLVIGGIVVVALVITLFWSRLITVRALPSSSSPALARATSRLAILQANLPRPEAIRNVVNSIKNKSNSPIIERNQNNETCGAVVDLSIINVSETHSFSQTGSFNSTRLVYSFRNTGQSMADNEYGYHAEWYVQTKPGGGVDTVTDKHYYCSGWENDTLTCMAPDWRNAQSASMSIVSDDPNCPFEVASFGFEGEDVYSASEPESICKDNINFNFSSASSPNGDSSYSEYCFHYSGGFPNIEDYVVETEPIDENGPPLLHGAFWYRSYGRINNDGDACFPDLTPLNIAFLPSTNNIYTGFFWKIINRKCRETVSSGIIDKNTGAEASLPGDDVQGNQPICPVISKVRLIESDFTPHSNDPDIFEGLLKFNIPPEVQGIPGEFHLSDSLNNGENICEIDNTNDQVICERQFNRGMIFDLRLEYQVYESESYIDCRHVLNSDHINLSTQLQGELNDHCRAFENTVISTVLLGWQKNDNFLLYFRFGGGVWGSARGLPGDAIPWEYQSKLVKGTDIENGTCHMESFNDRLFCSYPSNVSRWGGQSVDVSINAIGCKEYNTTILLPPLVEVPTEGPVIEEPSEPGCGSKPDPLNYPKSRIWCECNGGTYQLYTPPESGGPAGYCDLP